MSRSTWTLHHYFTLCNWWNVLWCVLRSVTYRKEVDSEKNWWRYSFPNVVYVISENYSYHKLPYPTKSRSAMGRTRLPPQWHSVRGVKPTTHFHLLTRLSGAIPPHPYTPSWRAQGQLYFRYASLFHTFIDGKSNLLCCVLITVPYYY